MKNPVKNEKNIPNPTFRVLKSGHCWSVRRRRERYVYYRQFNIGFRIFWSELLQR